MCLDWRILFILFVCYVFYQRYCYLAFYILCVLTGSSRDNIIEIKGKEKEQNNRPVNEHEFLSHGIFIRHFKC